MGLATVPWGEEVPKRTRRGTLVGAEGFTSKSAPLIVPFRSAFEGALPGRYRHNNSYMSESEVILNDGK